MSANKRVLKNCQLEIQGNTRNESVGRATISRESQAATKDRSLCPTGAIISADRIGNLRWCAVVLPIFGPASWLVHSSHPGCFSRGCFGNGVHILSSHGHHRCGAIGGHPDGHARLVSDRFADRTLPWRLSGSGVDEGRAA